MCWWSVIMRNFMVKMMHHDCCLNFPAIQNDLKVQCFEVKQVKFTHNQSNPFKLCKM